MEKKITKRDNFNALLALDEVKANETLVAFIKHELELLDRKANADKSNSPEAKANAELREAILVAIADKTPRTVTEICGLVGVPSNQKVTRQMTELRLLGKVEKSVVKGKSYYTAC